MPEEEKSVTFVVGGQELVAPVLTIQRLDKLWPSIEEMGKKLGLLEYTRHMSRVIAVATEKDEDKIDSTSLEDLGKQIARRLRATEVEATNEPFAQLLRISGMGVPAGGKAPATSPSTGTGTE
jgi:hypothetical protein